MRIFENISQYWKQRIIYRNYRILFVRFIESIIQYELLIKPQRSKLRVVYYRVLIIRCLFDEVNVDREERFHSCHLSHCHTSSHGKTSACGTCQRFVYFDEFLGLVRTGCLHSGDPRGATSCLCFWLPSTSTATLSPLQNASLQMQIASHTRFFPLYAAAWVGERIPVGGGLLA